MGKKISIGSLYSTFQHTGQHPVMGEKIPTQVKKKSVPVFKLKESWIGREVRCTSCKSNSIISTSSIALEFGIRCPKCSQYLIV